MGSIHDSNSDSSVQNYVSIYIPTKIVGQDQFEPLYMSLYLYTTDYA